MVERNISNLLLSQCIHCDRSEVKCFKLLLFKGNTRTVSTRICIKKNWMKIGSYIEIALSYTNAIKFMMAHL